MQRGACAQVRYFQRKFSAATCGSLRRADLPWNGCIAVIFGNAFIIPKIQELDFSKNQRRVADQKWMFVFDLDFTLWQFNCADLKPPLTMHSAKKMTMIMVVVVVVVVMVVVVVVVVVAIQSGRSSLMPAAGEVQLFDGARQAIQAALGHKNGILAVASASPTRDIACRLLHLFGLGFLTKNAEIYPGSTKEKHLKRLSKKLNVPMQRIMLFDDLRQNIRNAQKLAAAVSLSDAERGIGGKYCSRSAKYASECERQSIHAKLLHG